MIKKEASRLPTYFCSIEFDGGRENSQPARTCEDL